MAKKTEKPNKNNKLKRLKLTRLKVLETALGIAKSEGLEAISMRTVASKLHVEAMSLYKHVENKDDLLDGVIELMIQQIPLPQKNIPWQVALKERARAERKILSENSWIVSLFESRSGTGSIRLQHQNHMLGILRDSGFSIELAYHTMIAVTGYVYGFVIYSAAWSDKSKERQRTFTKAQIEIKPDSHPYIVEAISYAMNKKKNPAAVQFEEFDFGLDLLIQGIEKMQFCKL